MLLKQQLLTRRLRRVIVLQLRRRIPIGDQLRLRLREHRLMLLVLTEGVLLLLLHPPPPIDVRVGGRRVVHSR